MRLTTSRPPSRSTSSSDSTHSWISTDSNSEILTCPPLFIVSPSSVKFNVPTTQRGRSPRRRSPPPQLIVERATAVHDKYLPGNEIRLGEERDRSGNILGRACLPQWGAADIVLIRGLAGEADGARGHAVDGDLGGQGARQTARQHDHSRLGDAVVGI